MAQLSDDCFAFGGELMRIEDGLALIAARVSPTEARLSSFRAWDAERLASTMAPAVTATPLDTVAAADLGWRPLLPGQCSAGVRWPQTCAGEVCARAARARGAALPQDLA